VLSTARSVDRPYTNKATGQTVQLLLLTGAHSADFHTPKVCFPSQGWATGNERTIPFSGQMINVMDAEREGTKVSVWFWWYRNDPVAEMKLPDVPLVRDVYRFRLKIAGESASTSLFVRLIAPAGPAGDHAVKSLMNDIWAPIERLAATGGVRIVPGAVQPADGKQ
jgi:hypothetical protein